MGIKQPHIPAPIDPPRLPGGQICRKREGTGKFQAGKTELSSSSAQLSFIREIDIVGVRDSQGWSSWF
jgi:hypothetical protein